MSDIRHRNNMPYSSMDALLLYPKIHIATEFEFNQWTSIFP